jgi:predicted porin
MYGTLDVGVLTQNHGLNGDANTASTFQDLPSNSKVSNRVTGMASSNLTPSKWGIKGVEDMGGGMKTMFQLESALNINTGTNPNGRVNDSLPGTGTAYNSGEGSIQGQMFDREASLGVSGAWGELKAGRMTTTMADTIGAYDPLRSAYASSPLGFNGGYSGAGFTGEARWDNSIKYTKAFGATTLNLNYKTGGTTNGLKQGEGLGAALEYAQGNFSLKGSWASLRDAAIAGSGVMPTACVADTAIGKTCAATTAASALGAGVPTVGLGVPALAVTYADTNALALVGKLSQDKFTWKGGAQVITTKNPQNAAYDTANNMPSVNGLPVAFAINSGFNTPRVQKMFWVGANYQASSAWEFSGAVYRLNTSAYGSTPSVNTATTGYANAGVNPITMNDTSRATYYGLQSTYNFSPRTKWYASYMHSHTTGPAWSAADATTGGTISATTPNIITYTTGIVHTF